MRYYLKEIRLKQKLSLAQLSKKAGVARSHIQKIEAGETHPKLPVLYKLADALGVEVTALFGRDE